MLCVNEAILMSAHNILFIFLKDLDMGLVARKPVFATNTGADQHAHPCSLINAFVIRFLESIIC